MQDIRLNCLIVSQIQWSECNEPFYPHNTLHLPKLIVFKIQCIQISQCVHLFLLDMFNKIVGQIQSVKLLQVSQALHFADSIIGQIQINKFWQILQAFDGLDGVVVQK